MPVKTIYDLEHDVLPAHPDSTVVKWLGTLASPNAAALDAALLAVIHRAKRAGDHVSYYDSGDTKFHLKVHDGTTWQTIV